MNTNEKTPSILDKIILFFLKNKLIVVLLFLLIIGWGMLVAPFDWKLGGLPRDPVPVDAIPDLGDNQQIVFTDWEGRSPQDVEDQITRPLTVALLGIPKVKTIRSYSMFGFSNIYVIFEEKADFYWTRSRVLEKLNSLPEKTLPEGVQPRLGPDATALGQVFWYTLEGRDEDDYPVEGWSLQELRTIQDFYVRYGLQSAQGIAEVASIGGHVKEYQIDVDPDAMRAHDVTLEQVVESVQMSNLDVAPRTIEVNKVEYVIRGLGFIRSLKDIENAVIKSTGNVPIYIKNVANVTLGPAFRRGVLDKEGTEAVGGVVVVRYGENPLSAIRHVKEKIREISPGLPKKTLPDGTTSQVTIVPFYDRTGLIHETLNTLNNAIYEQILITIIVVILMAMHLRISILISGLLPLAVLMSFIAMRIFRVDANLVALSGIAIAIGTIVDMGIIVCESILQKMDAAPRDKPKLDIIFEATSEVGGAVVTAISTTIVSFLPIFTMIAAEGKLFKPLAFTKTFALFSSVIVALLIIPPLAHILFSERFSHLRKLRLFKSEKIGNKFWKIFFTFSNYAVVLIVIYFLAKHWMPIGLERGLIPNVVFVIIMIAIVIALFKSFMIIYPVLLRWCLGHKFLFLIIPSITIILGLMIWLGFERMFRWLPSPVKKSAAGSYLWHKFPGLGKEFMPPLNEGAFLYMPTTMPHASIGEVHDVLQIQDRAIKNIPEVQNVVGKLGRADSPLDPAPISMIETVITYFPEYILNERGKFLTFKYESDEIDYFRDEFGNPLIGPDGMPYKVRGMFVRNDHGDLIPQHRGQPFRLWRQPLDPEINPGRKAWKGITSQRDIWDEILKAAQVPGTTSAPYLQPIAARLVMLQSGMRAPMGIKVKGPNLETIEKVGFRLEQLLKEIPSVDASTVIADRIVGKPYLEIVINREAIARYGIMLTQVQDVIETAIGGRQITTTVEGRERYPVRVRYMRELRDNIESLERIMVSTPGGAQIPLIQIADIKYLRGPEEIKSEDTFLVGYVLFDKKPGWAEVEVVEQARGYLEQKIKDGILEIPAGVSYVFAGNYENQVRAIKRLSIILPLALIFIYIILYFQFHKITTTTLVFSGIAFGWAGGFLLIWLYSQPWFLDFTIAGINFRNLFQVHPINMSVAIWVGFIALFGIASDDGVVMATYLEQAFAGAKPKSISEIRVLVIMSGKRRIRACLMTTATTVLALLPVLTSTGRGSEIMIPMSIPICGGLLVSELSLLLVPTLYSLIQEMKFKLGAKS